MCVRPSFRLHGTTLLHLSIFRKSAENIQVSLTYDKNKGYFTTAPMYIYGSIFLNSS